MNGEQQTAHSIVAGAVGDLRARLQGSPIDTAVVVDGLALALASAAWPDAAYRVRRDRPPHRRDGTWRFDLLIERPDRVLAAIEVQPADERGLLSFSRLSLACARGVAETAYLVLIGGSIFGLERQPIAVARIDQPAATPIQIALYQAP